MITIFQKGVCLVVTAKAYAWLSQQRHMPGCHSKGRPRRRWTQDIKDCLHMTGAEAGHLAWDRHFFGMALMKAKFNNG